MDIDDIRRLNIKSLEGELGAKFIYEAMGMSQAQYYNLRDGAPDSKTGKPRGMRKQTAWRFEDAGRKPRGWLDTIHGQPNVEFTQQYSYIVDTNKIAHVPVIGKSMGGLPDRMFTDEGRPINGHDDYADIYSSDPKAFAVQVDGNSMFPRFRNGEYALVEPDTAPEVEDDVLVKITDGKVMLKRLISLRGGVTLGSYNDQNIYTFPHEEIVWLYYVAYSIPRRKILKRI